MAVPEFTTYYASKFARSVNPYFLFTLSGVIFAILPPAKRVYLALEKGKPERW